MSTTTVTEDQPYRENQDNVKKRCTLYIFWPVNLCLYNPATHSVDCYHPTHKDRKMSPRAQTTPVCYKYKKESDLKTIKRNARERNRVENINHSFEMLRQNIPSLAAVKNSSKINILGQAAQYIQYLEQLTQHLGTQQAVQQHTFYDSFYPQCSSPSESVSSTSSTEYLNTSLESSISSDSSSSVEYFPSVKTVNGYPVEASDLDDLYRYTGADLFYNNGYLMNDF